MLARALHRGPEENQNCFRQNAAAVGCHLDYSAKKPRLVSCIPALLHAVPRPDPGDSIDQLEPDRAPAFLSLGLNLRRCSVCIVCPELVQVRRSLEKNGRIRMASMPLLSYFFAYRWVMRRRFATHGRPAWDLYIFFGNTSLHSLHSLS